MGETTVTVRLPSKAVLLIYELVKEGDYRTFDDFVSEACRNHLNTWYSKRWNPKEYEK